MTMALKRKADGVEKSRRGPANLLALDFATTGIKAVRLKKIKEQIVLAALDILPNAAAGYDEKPELPKALTAYYAALCATMENATIRVFNQVLPEDDEDLSAIVRENLSAGNEYRTNGMVLSRAKGKRDSTVLGVAVPEKTVQHYLSLFDEGAPAPHSLELSGLSAFTAFLFNCGQQTVNQTICLIETGARFTYAAFLHRNQLQIVNRFDVGGDALQRQVQVALGVDSSMAGTILSGGSVDVSSSLRQVLNPFTRQLSIYREFVERQNKSALSAVYISGGQAASPSWQTAVKEVLGLIPQVWDPFEKIEIPDGVCPENLKGQEPRFAAAVGAALAGMEVL